MEEKYERLPEVVSIRGAGIDGLTATLIERTENKAIYRRNDLVYEVFRIKKAGAGEMFGKSYGDREVYPGNNDFGSTAWAYMDKNIAMELYHSIPDSAVYINTRGGDTEDE